MIERPSPNFDDRTMPVSMIVLHYTGMPDAEVALNRLTSPEAKVSCHYLIDEDGIIYRLVDEEKRAWHAGQGAMARHFRREQRQRRHRDGQSGPRVRLPRISRTSRSHRSSRSSPTSRSGTGSDAAMSLAIRTWRPRGRKIRASFSLGRRWPGYRLALPSPTRELIDPYLDGRRLPARSRALRLRVTDEQKAVIAFQRRFRPDLIDGIIDGECRAKLLSLLLPRPQ